jgi:tetratricopeptide (TPR) repeat protein
MGDYDDSIAQLEKVIQANPDYPRAHFLLAQAYLKKRTYDRALAETDRTAALGGGGTELRGLVGCIAAAAGRTAEARTIAEELAARYNDSREGGPVSVAAVYASLRDNDRAFEWLERGRQDREPVIGYLRVDPCFDNIRNDPRFETLLARLGLSR